MKMRSSKAPIPVQVHARKPVQDIYGTERRKADPGAFAPTTGADLLNQPWLEAIRHRRRTSFVLTLLILIIVGLITTMVTQYVVSAKRSVNRFAPRAVASRPTGTSPLDLSANPQTQLLQDELGEMAIMTIPAKGDMPLDTQWVKQAAYYLVQAEKAVQEDRLDEALEAYSKARLIYPDLKGVQRQVGLIYLRKKDYKAAAAVFEKVTTEEEVTFGLANNLGVSYLALENFKKAEENFMLAVRLNPHYPLAYFNLATLFTRTGDLAKAADYFEKYLRLKNDDVSAAQTYAMILIQLKRWDRAIDLLTQISAVAPDVAPIHFRLAEALSHTERNDQAMQSLKRATALVDPRKALSWMSRPEFNLLRNDPGFQQLLNELGTAEN